MTDDELKALVAENSLAIHEMRAERLEEAKRWAAFRDDLARQREESEKRWQEAREETEKLRAESEKRWQESRQETERLWQDVLASRQEMDRAIGSLERELGRLGNRLGGFVEDMFRPSLERTLREQFGMTVISSPSHIKQNGVILEIDMVGHAGSERDEVYLVEIKSQLQGRDIDQLHRHLRLFPQLYPEHRGKKLFGVLAALRIPADLRERVLEEGFYLATIKDDVFEIVPPDGFEPKAFGLRGLG